MIAYEKKRSSIPLKVAFQLQINLSPGAIETAQNMNPGKNVLQTIYRAKPYPKGCWLLIPVESEKDLQDIEQLLTLSAAEKRLMKTDGVSWKYSFTNECNKNATSKQVFSCIFKTYWLA